MPTQCSRREMRIEWSIVSNAALKSNSTSTADLPESRVSKISFRTLTSAVSVEWFFLNPDWNISKILFLSKKLCSWVKTIFSKIFDIKERFETGRKFVNTDKSKLVFFKKWVDNSILHFIWHSCIYKAAIHDLLNDGPNHLKH